MNAYVTKNLWNYEKLIQPPANIPKDLKTFYITDNESSKDKLADLGWDNVIIFNQFKTESDHQKRRRIISEINCFPQRFAEGLNDFDKVFVTDSNVVLLWGEYSNFVATTPEEKCLYLTVGWYSGQRDTIGSELQSSNQPRWGYDFLSMKQSVERYRKEYPEINNARIVSAKYFGWNLKHPSYKAISENFYEEYCHHLQGNIILVYLSQKYKNESHLYAITQPMNCLLNHHNFSA